MAIAGKVAITLSTENGGAWSADVTYDRLVAVKHNNNLYISRKTVANVEPPNNEFWFLALEGFGGEDVEALIERLNELSDLIQAIINGTTQVGNAKTLNGHGAEYFQVKNGDGHLRNAFNANDFTDSGRYSHGVASLGTNIPSTGTFIIDNCGTYIVQTVISYDTPPKIYVRISTNNGSTWGAWSDRLATEADLANYLPLISSGNKYGTAIDKRGLGAVAVYQKVINDALDGGLVASEGGVLGLRDDKNAKWIIGATSDGKIFIDGYNNTPLHTGNKPTGTYTGNGSAEPRTINVGGIGNVVLIRQGGSTNHIIADTSGFFGVSDGSFIHGWQVQVDTSCNIVVSSDSIFNASGVTYYWQVL